MPEPIDANGGGAEVATSPADASSALQSAFENHSTTPSPEPTPSAGTLKTAEAPQDGQQVETQDGEIPPEFHKHPRWQKLKEERDQIKQQLDQAKNLAQYGQTWQSALSSHPEFTKKIVDWIQEYTQAQQQQAVQNGQNPAQVPTDPFVQNLWKEVQELRSAYQQGSEFVRQEKFEKAVSKYQKDFQGLIGDTNIPQEFQEIFEERVWRNLQELAPEAVERLEYDPAAFKKAVEKEKQRFSGLKNQIVSSYTSEKLKQAVPKTQSGGISTLSAPSVSEDEELSHFVGQLKQITGA